MPRKPKREKQTVTFTVDGIPIPVVLHPPKGKRVAWYAYWNGLVSSKSTGHRDLQQAIPAAEHMVRNTGKRPSLQDTVLSDEEFESIQRAYFSRKQDPSAQARAEKTLDDCLEAISAFKEITRLRPITTATADHCATFQRDALARPRNWRKQYPNSQKESGALSANTVLKWSRSLQAAFERANRTAGKKCVRGVVDEKKLLTENPWKGFIWIEGKKRPIRQFDGDELVSFLTYLGKTWPGIMAATALAKVLLWSWGRRTEVAGLTWDALRQVGTEYHFETVGKWGVEKWFRVPDALYHELASIRTDSSFVFAAYADQLRRFYEESARPSKAQRVAGFDPANLANWLHKRISAWSKTLPKGHATMHIFRKTSMQYARRGEDINRQVAADVRVSPAVMMTHYVRESDVERRNQSNRTFERILTSMSPEVAKAYGHVAAPASPQEKVAAAVAAGDWALVAKLSAELAMGSQAP